MLISDALSLFAAVLLFAALSLLGGPSTSVAVLTCAALSTSARGELP